MARTLRVEYAGAFYHVINRGDRREAIFLDDEGRQCFIATRGDGLWARRMESPKSGG